jgi:PST family polysaccharide transporter
VTPEDYGLVAMVTAVTGFAPSLVDLGTRDAVLQRIGITEGELSALFWLTVSVGVLLALVICAGSPLIAAFYDEPRLTGIVLVSSVTFVAAALTAQHQSLLRRAVMFRELATIESVANVVSVTIAIVMGYVGFGYWALAVRPVAMYCLTGAGTWWYCSWLPGKPVVTSGVREMIRFGLSLSGFMLTDFVGRNSDRVMVGRGLGASPLGYYQNALFVYENILGVLVFPLHEVAVANLSKLHEDRERFRRSWTKALSTVVFWTMPVFGILAITSDDLIVLLLGQRWAMAGGLLSVLALRGIPHCAERTLGWLHAAAGRTDRWLKWGMLSTCVQLVALLCGLQFGVFGVVSALVVSTYVLFVPALVYAGHPFGIRSRDVVLAIGAQFAGALVSAGVGFGFRFWLLTGVWTIERVAVLVLLYVATYLVVVVGLFRVTIPLRVAVSLVKDIVPKQWRARGKSSAHEAFK